MKIKFRLAITLLGIFICTAFFLKASAQEKDDSGAAFERALRNYEVQKQREEAIVSEKLHTDLNLKIEQWLFDAKRNKQALIGSRLTQSWEKLSYHFKVSPSHYEYILKGYDYSIIKADVNKTDSLSSPYKADVIIKEELYVEKYHSPDISDPVPYFYTVTTEYNLHYVNKQEEFILLNSDNKIVNIENEVPSKISRPRL